MARKVSRCILGVDISSYTREGLGKDERNQLVMDLRRMLDRVLRATGLIPWYVRIRQKDTGDGRYYFFNTKDRAVAVNVVARLAELLREYNRPLKPLYQIRLRVALDAGEINLEAVRKTFVFHERFELGPAVDSVARMLESQLLHQQLDAAQDDLAFMLDETTYQEVVETGRTRYRNADFRHEEFDPDEAKTGTPKCAMLLEVGAVPRDAPPAPPPVTARLRVPVAWVQGVVTSRIDGIRRVMPKLTWLPKVPRRYLLIGMGGVAVLAVAALIAWYGVVLPRRPCPVPTQLVVLAAPGIVEQVEDLADDFADDHVDRWSECRLVNIRVFTAPSSTEAAKFAADGWPPDSEAITRLGPEPGVWIAASTGAIRTVAAELPPSRFERLGSVATSPLVLAVEPGFRESLGIGTATVATWDEIHTWQETASAGRIQLVRANPTASAAALLATEELYDAGTTTPGARRDLEATIRPAGGDEPTELCGMGTPPVTGASAPQALFTSEQRMVARNIGHPASGCGRLPTDRRLQAVYPHDEAGQTPFLDYPYTLLPAAFEHPRGRREDLARAFYDYLVAPEAQRRLATAGFRSRDHVLSEHLGTTEGVDPTQPDASTGPPALDAVTRTIARWQMARPAARLILSMDVSGSMGEPYAGGTRLGAAKEAAAELVRQLTTEDYVGLWSFAENLPPDNTSEYLSLVDLDRVDAQAAGLSQRERVLRMLDRLTWEHRGTRLYEMLVAGLDKLRQTGGPNEVRGLLVVTDGISEARPGAGPDEVLARLDEDVFLFLLVVGSAGCDLPGPSELDGHQNALCIDADTTGLPAAFARISTMLLGSGGV